MQAIPGEARAWEGRLGEVQRLLRDERAYVPVGVGSCSSDPRLVGRRRSGRPASVRSANCQPGEPVPFASANWDASEQRDSRVPVLLSRSDRSTDNGSRAQALKQIHRGEVPIPRMKGNEINESS